MTRCEDTPADRARSSAYLITITIMNALVGLATACVMWLCGLGDPVLWGAVVSCSITFRVPRADDWHRYVHFGRPVGHGQFVARLVACGAVFAIHLIEGETVTPMLLARRFTLSPVLVILSLIFE